MDGQSVILEVTEEALVENFDRLTGLTALNVGLLGACDWVLGVPLREVDEDLCTLREGVLAAELNG